MNPFDPTPSAWLDAIVFIAALAILGYTAFIVWPVLATAWLFLFW